MADTTHASSGSRHRVSNLEHGLDILEALRDAPAGLTLSELARQLELTKNLSFRITTTLLDRGYLVRDESSMRLKLGRKLLSMGYAAEAEVGLVEAALPIMRRLRDEFTETVTLCVLLEDEGMVLEAVPALHHFRFVVETGMRFSLHASAPAKAMLAELPIDEAMRRVALRGLTKLTATTICKTTQFRKALAESKTRRYAIDNQEGFDGMHCVAAAVHDRSGRPLAALNITGPAHRFPRQGDFEPAGACLIAAADELTNRLQGM